MTARSCAAETTASPNSVRAGGRTLRAADGHAPRARSAAAARVARLPRASPPLRVRISICARAHKAYEHAACAGFRSRSRRCWRPSTSRRARARRGRRACRLARRLATAWKRRRRRSVTRCRALRLPPMQSARRWASRPRGLHLGVRASDASFAFFRLGGRALGPTRYRMYGARIASARPFRLLLCMQTRLYCRDLRAVY